MRTPVVLLLVVATAGAGLLAARLIHDSNPGEVAEPRPADFERHLPSTIIESPALESAEKRVPIVAERDPDPEPVPAIDPADPRTLPEGTTDEMKTKYAALFAFLAERTTPIFERRAQQGFPLYVGETWTGGDTDAERREIYTVRGGGEVQGFHRDALPRSQYPELYVYKDEIYRLEKVLLERRSAEFRARAAALR